MEYYQKMNDADKTMQNTIKEGSEEEPPSEVPDSEMDFDTGERSIYLFAVGRSVFPKQRPLVWVSSGNNSIHVVRGV